MKSDEIIITETTVGNINGVSISCGNIYKRDKTDANGNITKEMSVTFRINVTQLHTLFLNSKLDFNGQIWKAVGFIKGEVEGRAKIKMKRLSSD